MYRQLRPPSKFADSAFRSDLASQDTPSRNWHWHWHSIGYDSIAKTTLTDAMRDGSPIEHFTSRRNILIIRPEFSIDTCRYTYIRHWFTRVDSGVARKKEFTCTECRATVCQIPARSQISSQIHSKSRQCSRLIAEPIVTEETPKLRFQPVDTPQDVCMTMSNNIKRKPKLSVVLTLITLMRQR